LANRLTTSTAFLDATFNRSSDESNADADADADDASVVFVSVVTAILLSSLFVVVVLDCGNVEKEDFSDGK